MALRLDDIWEYLRARMLARGGVNADELDRAAAQAKCNLARAKRAHGPVWRNDIHKVWAVHMWLRDLVALTGADWSEVTTDVRALVARAEGGRNIVRGRNGHSRQHKLNAPGGTRR